MSRARPLGVGEFLFQEARRGVADVRQKLFEEAWFGRPVTAEPVARDNRTLTQSFNDIWGRAEQAKPEQSRPEHELDR